MKKFLILSTLAAAWDEVSARDDLGYETLFVLEMNRHGARSPMYGLPSPVPKDLFKVGKGQLTGLGFLQHQQLGLERRREYIIEKGLLSEKFDSDEFLSVSTHLKRTYDSGLGFLTGLYPLQSFDTAEEM